MRAKEVAIGQASDAGASSQTRLMASTEIEQIYSQAVQIGNRRFGERFIFGGFQTKKAPFENNGNYIGDDGDMKVQIQKDSFVAMNIPGDKVFLGRGAGADGFIRPKAMTSRTTDQLLEEKEYENYRNEKNQEIEKQAHIDVRGPASRGSSIRPGVDEDSLGVNIFNVLSDLNIALKTNDKKEIQRNLDSMDLALQQVVFTRSQVGSRVSILNSNLDSLQKNSVDSKLIASQLEDADAFQVFSEMNKSDSALKATLQTTGKLIQPSLLDFIK
jgi:flagellar hook-associated protein 3 FlgL